MIPPRTMPLEENPSPQLAGMDLKQLLAAVLAQSQGQGEGVGEAMGGATSQALLSLLKKRSLEAPNATP